MIPKICLFALASVLLSVLLASLGFKSKGLFITLAALVMLGTLGVALGAGLHLLWCLILPTLQPIAFFTGHLLARVITEKNT